MGTSDRLGLYGDALVHVGVPTAVLTAGFDAVAASQPLELIAEVGPSGTLYTRPGSRKADGCRWSAEIARVLLAAVTARCAV